jgi:Cu+-exporting ATPase
MILKAFTSVLIVACPCALALSIPFTYSNVMRIFGNKGFYLKNNEVLERLYDIDTIVFDKTGTITQSDVHDINFISEVTLANDVMVEIASLAKHSTHTLSQSVFKYLQQKYNIENFEDAKDFNEIAGKGIEGKVNGKLFKLGSDIFVSGKKIIINEFESNVHISIDGNYSGKFILNSKLRDNLENVLTILKAKHYELHLISGDTIKDNDRFKLYFNNNLHFNQSPENKLNYIKDLQNKGKKVLMIGDGLNDAGALLQSNLGISIADDIYHFSPACDAILKADSFERLSTFISFSKTTRKIIQASFLFSFAYNSVGLYYAVTGMLSPIVAAILMPLSSITVVGFVTLFSTVFTNKALKK